MSSPFIYTAIYENAWIALVAWTTKYVLVLLSRYTPISLPVFIEVRDKATPILAAE